MSAAKNYFQYSVTTSATAVNTGLDSSVVALPKTCLLLYADDNNVGNIYVGNSSDLTTSIGWSLPPGKGTQIDAVEFRDATTGLLNLGNVYVVAAATGNTLYVRII
jgi:hypothetical protein